MIIYIYALIDPITNEVRYVGRTNDPKRRMEGHLNSSAKGNKGKFEWIAQLKAQGKRPQMTILEECTPDTWEAAEKRWIAHYRAINTAMTNKASGGHGRDAEFPFQKMARVSPEMRKDIDEIRDETGATEADIFRNALSDLIARYKKAKKKKEKGSK
jgi:hypothetical protein